MSRQRVDFRDIAHELRNSPLLADPQLTQEEIRLARMLVARLGAVDLEEMIGIDKKGTAELMEPQEM